MAITSTQQTDILKVVAGLFNAAPGGTFLTDFAKAVEGGMTIAQLANTLAGNSVFTTGIMGGKVTTDAQAAVLMKNFGLVADSTTTSAGSQALAYFKAQIDAKVGFGKIVFDAVTFLSNASIAAEFKDAATLLSNKALVAAAYSASNSSTDLGVLQNILSNVTGTAAYTSADVDAILVSSGGGTSGGKSFTLTTGIDSISGGSGADTVSAVVSTVAGSTTLNAGDIVDGSGGDDRLNLILDGASPSYSPVATIKNIEQVYLKNVATGTGTFNAVGTTGIKEMWSDGSLNTVAVTNLESLAKIGLNNTEKAMTVNFANAAVAGATDDVKVSVSGASKGSSLTLGNTSGTEGIETVTLGSDGTKANVLDSLLSNQGDFSTLNIIGSQDLTLSAVDDTLTKIDANLLTAKLTLDASAAATAKAVTIVGTGKDDKITVATTDSNDNIDGGAGTDTVVSTGSFGATLTNIEALELTGALATPTANLDKAQSITSFTATSTVALTGLSVTNAAAGIKATVKTDTNSTLTQGSPTITLKTATGSADEVFLTFAGNGTITAGALTGGADTLITATTIETVNLAFNGGAAALGVNGTAQTAGDTIIGSTTLNKVVLTGSAAVDLQVNGATGDGLSNNVSFSELDASGLSGILTMNTNTIQSTSSVTVKGGTNNDTLFGTAQADTITGGTGNDSITGEAGADTIDAGVGNDTIFGGDGADKMTGGDGSDNFILGSLSQTGNVISDFDAGTSSTNVDVIQFDINGSGETGAFTSGVLATAIAQAQGAATDPIAAVAGAVSVLTVTTDDQTAAAGNSLFLFNDGVEYTATSLQTALQTAGARTITTGSDGTVTATNYLAVYDKGSTIGIAVITTAANATTTNSATVVEIAELTGISSLANFNAGDFLFI